MSKIEEIFKIAYDFAYDLGKLKKQYSEVKIYDAGGDISKRWYVYYSFRNPITGKLERQPYIDTGIADTDLEDIFDYTNHKFGYEQAENIL